MQPPQGRVVPAMAPKGGSNDPRLMLKLQTAIVDTERLGELFLDVRRQASIHACCAQGISAESAARHALHITPHDVVSSVGFVAGLQKVECDKQRQALREALTALKKTQQSKAWLMRPGGVLVKSSADDARSTLERGACSRGAACRL